MIHEASFGASLTECLGSTAALAIICISVALMVGILKQVDAFKLIAIILGITIMLVYLTTKIVNAWSLMSLRRRLGVACLGVVLVSILRPSRSSRSRSER